MLLAPSGFLRRLRAFDPALSVRFNTFTGGWQILQTIKRWENVGFYNGMGIIMLRPFKLYVGEVPGLGDNLFRELRRGFTGRFNTNHTYEDFCKEWNVETE